MSGACTFVVNATESELNHVTLIDNPERYNRELALLSKERLRDVFEPEAIVQGSLIEIATECVQAIREDFEYRSQLDSGLAHMQIKFFSGEKNILARFSNSYAAKGGGILCFWNKANPGVLDIQFDM